MQGKFMSNVQRKNDPDLEQRVDVEAHRLAIAAGWTKGTSDYAAALDATRRYARRKFTFDWSSPRVGIPINWNAVRNLDFPTDGDN